MTTDLILGTAGHIDHGKTSLVRSLTGVDTDRLPEEQRRGITIELGFAELLLGEYRLGIVDVPGHERFVRNMLAGATGMDLAMLVVAADDSVKPQTREHLEILRLLNLEAGVIAVTKCDLVEPEWLELVEEEIRAFVAGSFLAEAPVVFTSTVTGSGLDELRNELTRAAVRVSKSRRLERLQGPFRLAIDRAFTVAGHGTVVTGSVSSGQCRVGDELAIEPGSIRVRVRGLQNHDRQVDEVHRGQRAAVNLVGIHHESVQRGQELCWPEHLKPARLLTAEFSLLESAPQPLKDRARVRVHMGTAEIPATLRLLGPGPLAPGHSSAVQLSLRDPAVAVWGQPFVVRRESPVATLGGGIVLDPDAERIRRTDSETLAWVSQLGSRDPAARASAALYFVGFRGWSPADLPRTAGVDSTDVVHGLLADRGRLAEIPLSPTRVFRLHRRILERLCDRIEAALRKLHDRFPLKSTLDRSLLNSGFRFLADPAILAAALEDMQAAGRVCLDSKGVALVGHGPRMSQNERRILAQILATYRAAGLETPSTAQCRQQMARGQESIPQLLKLAAENGDLVQVAPDFYLHADVERETRTLLEQRLAGGKGLTMSEIREILNTTRKYAVPLCEYFDRVGFTQRRGDVRFLAAAADHQE